MEVIERQHFQAAPAVAQLNVQPGTEEDRALQEVVQQSRGRRQAKQRSTTEQRLAEQHTAPIAIGDDDQAISHMQLGLDKTGLKSVPKQRAKATDPDPTKMKLRALQLEVETEQETAMQQLVQVQSSSAKSTTSHNLS
eukprot:6458620-Amphidinium_carterae.1